MFYDTGLGYVDTDKAKEWPYVPVDIAHFVHLVSKEYRRELARIAAQKRNDDIAAFTKTLHPSLNQLLVELTQQLVSKIHSKGLECINLDAFAASAFRQVCTALWDLSNVYVPSNRIDEDIDFRNYLETYNVVRYYPLFIGVTVNHEGAEDWNLEYNSRLWKWYVETKGSRPFGLELLEPRPFGSGL
jgi:hypothetical protein